MAEIRTNLRISVDGDGKLVSVEQAMGRIASNTDKATASLSKFGTASKFSELGSAATNAAGKVDQLTGGVLNLSSAASMLANPWVLAGAAVTSFGVAMKKTIDEGGKIADLSAKYRMTTEEIQRLGNVGELAGVSMEDFAGAIFKLRRNLADSPQKFRDFGIDVEKWKNLGSVELAAEFAKVMESIGDESEAAAAGMELAGKGYLSMAAALKSKDLEESLKQGVALTERQVEAADALGDRWTRVKQIMGELWKGKVTGALVESIAAPFVEDPNGGKPRVLADIGKKQDPNQAAADVFGERTLTKKQAAQYVTDPAKKKQMADELKEEQKQAEKIGKIRAAEAEKSRKLEEEARALSMKAEDEALKDQAERDKKLAEDVAKAKEADEKALLSEQAKMRAESMKDQEQKERQMRDRMNRDGKAWIEQLEQGRKKLMNADDWEAYNRRFDAAIDKAQRMAGLFGTLREGLLAMGVGADSFAMKMAVGLEMGAAAKEQLLESIKKNDKMGMASAGIGALMSSYKSGSFLGGAATGALAGSAFGMPGAVIGGLVGGIAGLFGKKSAKDKAKEKYGGVDTGDFFGQMAAKTEFATKDFLKLMNAAKGSAQYVQWMGQNLDLAAGGVNKMADAMQYLGKDGARAVAGMFSSSFWATMKEKGLAAATETFGPIFDKVSTQLADMGLDPASLGMDRVQRMMNIGRDPKTAALLGAVQGNADFLRGTLNAGFLNTTDLQNSGKVATATYNELKNQGLDTKEAYEQMADYLSAVQKASEASGKAIPDEIQKMIAEAKANGIEFTKQPIEQLSGYTKEIRDFLLGKGISSGGSGGGGSTGPNVTYDEVTGTTSGWGPRPSGYPGDRPWPPDQAPAMASGGYVPPRRGGTLVRLGEGGEGEIVTPVSRMGGGGGGMTVVLGGPSFSPTTTAEDRRELIAFHAREAARQFSQNPTVRAAAQRTERQWRRRR